jgi:hypothetical protein
MAIARYILAKYAPDLARMEPRNIGVVVWHNGVFAKIFLDAKDAASIGVGDETTYERWMAYWSRLLTSDEVRPRRGKPVPVSDAASIDAFISTQKGNYMLVDAGEIIKPLKKADLKHATEYLFNDLVATRKQKKRTLSTTFRKACTDVLDSASIVYKMREPVECSWGGVKRVLHPDYYIGNGHPDTILQRVELPDESSVNASALLVHAILNAGVVNRKNCRFLVRSSDATTDNARASLELCDGLCGYVDIDQQHAAKEIRELVAASVRTN